LYRIAINNWASIPAAAAYRCTCGLKRAGSADPTAGEGDGALPPLDGDDDGCGGAAGRDGRGPHPPTARTTTTNATARRTPPI
jgi:hypothetical protein